MRLIKDASLCLSAIAKRIYIAKVNKDGFTMSGDKKDVTDDFHRIAVLYLKDQMIVTEENGEKIVYSLERFTKEEWNRKIKEKKVQP